MKSKLLILVGAGAGYVLGARAGRERYDEIVVRAKKLWNDPKVQDTVADVEQAAKAKAPQVQQKVTDAASQAASAAKSKVSRNSDDDEVVIDTTTTTATPLDVPGHHQ